MKQTAASVFLVVLLAGCDTGGEEESRSTDTTVVPAAPVTNDPNVTGANTLPAEDAYGTASGTGTGTAGSLDGPPGADMRAEGGGSWGEVEGDRGAGTIDGAGTDASGADVDRLQDPAALGDDPADSTPAQPQPPVED